MKPPKLTVDINKALLILCGLLPQEIKEIWFSIDELRDVLVIGGVHRSLSSELLGTALTRANKSGFMEKRTDGHGSGQGNMLSFYRHASLQHEAGAPLDQRTKVLSRYSNRLPHPPRDCFKIHPDIGDKLERINTALLQYSEDNNKYEKELKNAEKEKKKAEKEKETEKEKAADNSGDNTNTNQTRNNTPANIVTPPQEPYNPDVRGNNSNGIFDIKLLSAFIHEVSTHAAQCGVSVELQDVNKNFGAGIIQKWDCTKCGRELEFRNCKWIKTGIVEEGRRSSRPQPEIK